MDRSISRSGSLCAVTRIREPDFYVLREGGDWMAEVKALSALSEQEALEHILKHHASADGWITLSRKDGGRYRQYHYRVNDLPKAIKDWLGEDVFFSQNTFYKPTRRIENIRQLRSLYVDVDAYLLNLDPEWVIGSMESNLFQQRLPDPNFIIYSGRGLVLVWLLDPVPPQALPLWQAVENHFVRTLKRFGSDAKASDAARVLRLAGTVNSKSNEVVNVQYRHQERYVLRELEREYLPEIRPRKKGVEGAEPPPKIHNRMYRVYSLHYVRMQDLVQLCELRTWNMTGHREMVLFLYRYWSCCFLYDPDEALQNTLELNDQFTEPLDENEVIKATRSAEKAWKAKTSKEANEIAREKGYPGAGYNISNDKLIEWLDITQDEQRQLESIIGRRVKYDRNNTRREKVRRTAGQATREEYIDQAQKRRQEALRMRGEGVSYSNIAKVLGCSKAEVIRLCKMRTNDRSGLCSLY